jgi:hypothetical protein
LAKVPKIFNFEAFGGTEEGILISTQAAGQLPFPVKRIFWLHQVPVGHFRGHHAHHTTEEILITIQGSITVNTETYAGTQVFTLDSPIKALYLPAQCWVTYTFSPGALLLCLTSTDYDPADYIRDYNEFQSLIRQSG